MPSPRLSQKICKSTDSEPPLRREAMRFMSALKGSPIAALAAAILLFSANGCAKKESPPKGEPAAVAKLKVGFITVGPTTDYGYNYQHDKGRRALEAAMPDQVTTVLAENVPETADVERVMERMVSDGAKLIFATSYGYLDSALRVAEKHPDVTFMHCLGTKQSKNLGTYSANLWEPAYVAGAVAAKASPGNVRFGFVGAHPIPPVYWILNAFALGAQSVDPAATVETVFTNSWNDPAAETEAVNSLASKGVAGVYILVDSPIAGVQAAERGGIFALAQHADLSKFAPQKWITGSEWGWAKLYEDVARSVIDGTWKSGHISGGFREDYVALAPFGPAVSQDSRSLAATLQGRIASGELNVFGGPIVDSKGAKRVPAGGALTIDQILSFDWVVKGVGGAG
jgi:basic membrane protein A and related proteins